MGFSTKYWVVSCLVTKFLCHSVKGVRSPVRTVVGFGNNLLHHQLCLPQLLLQLGQLEISWRAKKGQSQEKGLWYV